MFTIRRPVLVLVVALAACRAGSDSPTAPNVIAPIDASLAKKPDPGLFKITYERADPAR